MKVIIAEKPSVARAIAAIVGATKREDGYIQGNGYSVTWALGHLVSLAMPEAYGVVGFRRENLPIIPSPFKQTIRQIKEKKEFKVDPGAVKQLNIIKTLFDTCDSIIVATDAGREGELIFRYIYKYLNCTKPFERLWISSLTDKAINDGMNNLKNGSEYDNLYLAAKARSEADWVVGINASQALSIVARSGSYSLGRVQTPTLMMICERYKSNKDFKTIKHQQIVVKLRKDNVAFAAHSLIKYDDEQLAEKQAQFIEKEGQLTVVDVVTKDTNENAPLLHDLTSLQKEANKRYGYTAQETLTIAQGLYERKFITYPRTGSKYIPEDVFAEIEAVLNTISSNGNYSKQIKAIRQAPLNKRSVNDDKVTDHHALLVTENRAVGLSQTEQQIYDMIVIRVLEAFMPKCVKQSTAVTFECNGQEYTTRATQITEQGWRAIRNEKQEAPENGQEDEGENDLQESVLPVLSTNDKCEVVQVELVQRQTKPKPLHTEGTLLASMENAGRELEDTDERQAMRESGIGTPATRASIIETLFSRDYIQRDKKTLVPTEKGLAVYDVVKDKKIANIQMTGMWENALTKIEQGEMDSTTFASEIIVYARQITAELLGTTVLVNDGVGYTCPKCSKAKMKVYENKAKCSDKECGLSIFRERSGKHISDKQLENLLTKGCTWVIKGFTARSGKVFDSKLAFDDNFNVIFQAADDKDKS